MDKDVPYPPKLPAEELEVLVNTAIDYALSHGLIVRPAPDKTSMRKKNASVVHAPFALYPTRFPRHEYEKAIKLQKPWNTLVHRMSQDHDLITETMQTLSTLDPFVNGLYQIYLKVREEGIAQTASLGIHRNDYLLHANPGADAKTAVIKQVEFNTVSASFCSLSQKVTDLHRSLATSIKNYGGTKPMDLERLPENKSIKTYVEGLAAAWKHYGKNDAVVVMITQPNERNVFDQRWIEYQLFESYGIPLIRYSFEDIANKATLDPNSKALLIDGKEVAVTYFRAGYGPEDYPDQKAWDARLLIERSLSIKCPTVAYQLIGSKKVQQVLSEANRLERYISEDDSDLADEIRSTFAGLYPLDQTPEGLRAYELALADPEGYVMKPQREGGGHNVYGQDILDTLQKLTAEERSAYILMDIIRSPPLNNIMIREGETIHGDVVSELGVYGAYLADGDEEILNHTGGHLLRTKATTTREGGVAAGFAVIDSPILE
ncbi:glutathione synthase [Mycotypha africana]|uniref:glutathione synthase n=1 Tax=Mycotypha africana TaxID=64632 RepID=UPI002301468A|nr:glutathione synthase [Mycotypha africana]KAI8988085.1 glutathione synthase [Mycotypha africana]